MGKLKRPQEESKAYQQEKRVSPEGHKRHPRLTNKKKE
jgi:hypothetical protein